MVDGQKPMLDNSIKNDGLLSAPDVNSTNNNQPWKKPAVGSRPGSIFAFQDLHLNHYTTWLASQRLGHQVEVITEAYALYSVKDS